MATKIETFDPVSIKDTSLQFKDDSSKIGCLGSIEGETEMREIVKRCEGVEVRKRSKPEKMNLTLSAHVKVEVLRKVYGLSDDDLKPGIWKYTQDAKGEEFVLTANVIDEFEDVTKLIAFPNCVSETGLAISIENGADEVAEIELEFTVYPDDNKSFYYESFIDELDGDDAEEIQDEWHTDFDTELVVEESA